MTGEFGVLLEEVREMFRGLAEGQKILQEKVNKLAKEVNRNSQAVAMITEYLDKVEREFNSATGRFAGADARELYQLKKELMRHDERLTLLERRTG